MTTRIKIKKGAGTPSGLTFGELAYDVTNKKLFIGITGGNALLANTDGGVASIRGLTGTVGITNGNGIGLSVSGQTMTFSNTGVLSINGGTGAVANVARTNVDNNFSTAQTIDGPGTYLEISKEFVGGLILTPGVGIQASDTDNSPQTLQFNPTFTTTTVTLPNYTTTLAGLSGNQTFTALNTFNSGISAAGGVTFSGNFSGATGSFSRLLTASAGISASNITTDYLVVAAGSTFGAAVDHIFGLSNRGLRINAGKGDSEILSYGNEILSVNAMGGSKDLNLFGGIVTVGDDGNNDGTQITVADTVGQRITYTASGGHVFNGIGSFSGLLTASAGISAASGITLSGNVAMTSTSSHTGLASFAGGLSAAGSTFSGNVNLQDNTLSRIELLDYCERFVDLGDFTSKGSQIAIDMSTGQVFRTKITTACTGLNVTNVPDNGNANAVGFSLLFVGDGTPRSMTWNIGSTAAAWAGGIAPTYTSTSNKIDVYSFLSRDGGSTWLGFVGGQNF
jgi:hypothetical protein